MTPFLELNELIPAKLGKLHITLLDLNCTFICEVSTPAQGVSSNFGVGWYKLTYTNNTPKFYPVYKVNNLSVLFSLLEQIEGLPK